MPDGPAMRDKPTLVLLHGGPGYDHTSFKPVFSRLADVAQVVYVDHRGHGRSDRGRPPSGRWTPSPTTWCGCATRWASSSPSCSARASAASSRSATWRATLRTRHSVILSRTSDHLGLERKLAMFEQLGGARRAAAAEASGARRPRPPGRPTSPHCKPLYDPVQPDHHRRPVSSPLQLLPILAPLHRQRDAGHGPGAWPGRRSLPGAGDGGRARTRSARRADSQDITAALPAGRAGPVRHPAPRATAPGATSPTPPSGPASLHPRRLSAAAVPASLH